MHNDAKKFISHQQEIAKVKRLEELRATLRGYCVESILGTPELFKYDEVSDAQAIADALRGADSIIEDMSAEEVEVFIDYSHKGYYVLFERDYDVHDEECRVAYKLVIR